MLGPPTRGTSQVLGAAAAAISCSLLSHHLASRETELHSEVLCWILLPLLSRLSQSAAGTGRLSKPVLDGRSHAASPSSGLLWVLAFCISVAAVFKSENGEIALQVSDTFLFTGRLGIYQTLIIYPAAAIDPLTFDTAEALCCRQHSP